MVTSLSLGRAAVDVGMDTVVVGEGGVLQVVARPAVASKIKQMNTVRRIVLLLSRKKLRLTVAALAGLLA
jgi:hypothetical protein